MELTARQRAFLDRMLDLYRETRQPIHYSTAAQKLGIGATTAYEMLKLLEKKGYVTSDYVLAEGSGPGRSAVVFYPTAKARVILQRLAGRKAEEQEWTRVKERILSKLGQGAAAEQELLNEILAKISSSDLPLIYCAEVITALLLNLGQEIRSKLAEHDLIKSILALDVPDQPLLSLLPGFALGISLTDEASRHVDRLMEYAREYQRRLQILDSDRYRDLLGFVREVVAVFQT